MALSPEMQEQVDMQLAIENNRAANQAAQEAARAKLDAVRMAKKFLSKTAGLSPPPKLHI